MRFQKRESIINKKIIKQCNIKLKTEKDTDKKEILKLDILNFEYGFDIVKTKHEA